MKKLLILTIFILCGISASAQEQNEKAWSFRTDANFYFFTDDFIFLPVVSADKDHVHLEMRYNYEDLNTLSTWVGYNFYGGNKLEYFITPMLGAVVGNSNGIAPGLETTLTLGSFEVYSESEYFIDFQESENQFIYTWTDLTYSPLDWLWTGISAQRTRLYQTDLDLQRGIILGGGFKNLELTSYWYNIGTEDNFLLFTLSANF
ncbi:hypothetical protein D0X99_00935 [Algoriphagus lacus]|uniref:DUF481 domain-containing protein n=1 Tax=Algoriphagus lacus TaxID=2056311 RepID=A0A418PVW0_9BACT|nr:hypothetical protein [Algoriphagus lacus]RIW18294.1 hypothetical protein D0X99_00935 [Algoriphagus lacus]